MLVIIVNWRARWVGARTIAFDVEYNSRRENFVPAVNHPDHPSRIDLADKGQADMRKAGDTTQWVDEE